MSRWIDVWVNPEDTRRALAVIVANLGPIDCKVDASTGRVSLCGRTGQQVRAVCRQRGVLVLHIESRIDAPLDFEPPESYDVQMGRPAIPHMRPVKGERARGHRARMLALTRKFQRKMKASS